MYDYDNWWILLKFVEYLYMCQLQFSYLAHEGKMEMLMHHWYSVLMCLGGCWCIVLMVCGLSTPTLHSCGSLGFSAKSQHSGWFSMFEVAYSSKFRCFRWDVFRQTQRILISKTFFFSSAILIDVSTGFDSQRALFKTMLALWWQDILKSRREVQMILAGKNWPFAAKETLKLTNMDMYKGVS